MSGGKAQKAEIDVLRAEVEALRAELALVRSMQSAHVCGHVCAPWPQPYVYQLPTIWCNGAAAPPVSMEVVIDTSSLTFENVHTLAAAGCAAGVMQTYTVNV